MNIKYIGSVQDYSGYGEANRHDVASLLEVGANVTVKAPKYTLEIADFGKLGEKINAVINKEIDYDYIILHTTPNVWPSYMERGKYHIGRCFWETDKLPADFAKACEQMDELWTGSEFNARAIKKAGVTKPIYIIPEAIDVSNDVSSITPYMVANEKDYKFYSIFEWTERKNPTALLSAFWLEFENTPDVSLTLKTYVDNFTPEKKKEIDGNFTRIKRRLGLSNYAPVYIYKNLMDRHQIYRLHRTFDCYVSAHRGEGWGIPQMEALLVGNPIISTNCGGIHEYLQHEQSAMLIPYELVPLLGNNRNQQWYTQDQNWAEVDIWELRRAMRWCFENSKKAKKMGLAGQKIVKDKFCFTSVGTLMKKRLTEIGR